MTNIQFDRQYETYHMAVEDFLGQLFLKKPNWAELYDAMRYSLLAGGKRLRPILTLEFARLCGLDWHMALPVGCALELVHTYSLIHDDLPCMDNDDLRRGKPTNHRVYGETLAVLAGDALQPAAYELILNRTHGLPHEARLECALLLAEASGHNGMVAGQVLDTLHTPKSEAALTEVHQLKTGCMIRAACAMGCAAANAAPELREAACAYAENLGLAFQIRDDMLDVIGNTEEFGKPIGSDKDEGKVTFVDLLGLEECERRVLDYTERAKAALQQGAWQESHLFLCKMADTMTQRMK